MSMLVVMFTVLTLQGAPMASVQHRVAWPAPLADCEAKSDGMAQSVAEAFAPPLEAYWTRVSGDTVMLVRKQWCEAVE